MQSARQQPGKRALIVTVGVSSQPSGADIVDALMIDIEAYRPDHLILASTDLSRPIADALAHRAKRSVPTIEHLDLPSAHDLDLIFNRVRGVIQRLIDEGYSNENIAVNYASGTKVMSSGLALAAVFNACGSLRYVRSASTTAPAERLIATPARAVFANRDIALAKVLATELRFQLACSILRNVHSDFLSEAERQVCKDLITLFEAYDAWNGFRVGRFLELYESVEDGRKELDPFLLSDESLEAARELGRAIARRKPSSLICLDLYNSAKRYRRAGDYNDAVARLYRAMEILAQERMLEKWGIDPDNVMAQKVPPRYRPDFEALRSMQDGVIRLGLRKSYELLYRLGDDLGSDFHNDPHIAERLAERRSSMLAHGVDPIDARECNAFFDWTTVFFERHIEAFQERRKRLQFPWFTERRA